jgi:hypothetical protein
MPTPADERLLELLDKWLGSIDLHIRYSGLDEDSYWKVQTWIDHQRPTRWILDLARQKTVALRDQVTARVAAGDGEFSDSLELMIFLANLVGSEHIERYIPLAEAQNERVPVAPPAPVAADSSTGTREMPRFPTTRARQPAPAATPTMARNERTAPVAKAQPAAAAKPSARRAQSEAQEQVIADATRLVQWGRKWFELPELIARMADRPSLAEVRRILKENKKIIDEQSAKR